MKASSPKYRFPHMYSMLISGVMGVSLLSPASVLLSQATSVESQSSSSHWDQLFESDLWNLSTDEFMQKFASSRFRLISDKKEGARTSFPVKILKSEIDVVETEAGFHEDKLSRLNFSIFNRGDVNTTFSREKFEAAIQAYSEALSSFTGVQKEERKSPQSAVSLESWVWKTPKTWYLLESSFQREIKTRNQPFRAEFIRLRVAPAPENALIGGGMDSGVKSRPNDLVGNVEKGENGEVMISSVPMVDQGEKGYCVVASTERLMRYYALPVDQHELAQIANSTAEGGTDPSEMIEALKKMQNRLRLRVRDHISFDIRNFTKFLDDYNRVAKRFDKREIDYRNQRVIDVGRIYANLDVDALREVRLKGSGYRQYMTKIREYVNRGIPLLWGVQLGKVPERGIPQTGGGHMRLIIGYNDKTQELIYSDSWGAGHEQKTMNQEDAYVITTSLFSIEPLAR